MAKNKSNGANLGFEEKLWKAAERNERKVWIYPCYAQCSMREKIKDEEYWRF